MPSTPEAGPTSRPARYSPRLEQWPPSAGGPDAAPTASGDLHFDEAVEALLCLLGQELAPPLALSTAGWTLYKLLDAGASGAELRPRWRAALAAAVASRRRAAAAALRGPWCDALPAMASPAWARSRQAVLHTGAGTLHAAANAWAQGGQVRAEKGLGFSAKP